ncbi:hypothetical protein [Variovorax rhizosphaerae]|uniref:Uncharacterized protein n=1 Tax=Variovorax rhizosphaerae TaxID=1836200 RepID=A0ABU8WYL7_9BURK
MTNPGPSSAGGAQQPPPLPLHGERLDEEKASLSAAEDAARSRFGAAAIVLDRLDTRPLHLRTARRAWWKFWA